MSKARNQAQDARLRISDVLRPPGADAEVLPGKRVESGQGIESAENAVCRHSGGRSNRDDGVVEVRGSCML